MFNAGQLIEDLRDELDDPNDYRLSIPLKLKRISKALKEIKPIIATYFPEYYINTIQYSLLSGEVDISLPNTSSNTLYQVNKLNPRVSLREGKLKDFTYERSGCPVYFARLNRKLRIYPSPSSSLDIEVLFERNIITPETEISIIDAPIEAYIVILELSVVECKKFLKEPYDVGLIELKKSDFALEMQRKSTGEQASLVQDQISINPYSEFY
jgi:hypothetical protein